MIRISTFATLIKPYLEDAAGLLEEAARDDGDEDGVRGRDGPGVAQRHVAEAVVQRHRVHRGEHRPPEQLPHSARRLGTKRENG